MTESPWWKVYDVLWWINLVALIGACVWFYPRIVLAIIVAVLNSITN